MMLSGLHGTISLFGRFWAPVDSVSLAWWTSGRRFLHRKTTHVLGLLLAWWKCVWNLHLCRNLNIFKSYPQSHNPSTLYDKVIPALCTNDVKEMTHVLNGTTQVSASFQFPGLVLSESSSIHCYTLCATLYWTSSFQRI